MKLFVGHLPFYVSLLSTDFAIMNLELIKKLWLHCIDVVAYISRRPCSYVGQLQRVRFRYVLTYQLSLTLGPCATFLAVPQIEKRGSRLMSQDSSLDETKYSCQSTILLYVVYILTTLDGANLTRHVSQAKTTAHARLVNQPFSEFAKRQILTYGSKFEERLVPIC